jgi:hypothetical protein
LTAAALPSMSESDLMVGVIDLAHALGWRVAHFRPALNRRGYWSTPVAADGAGFPDLILTRSRDGRALAAELKAGRGRVTAEQRAWLDDLAAAGITTFVRWPADYPDRIAATLR